MKVLIVGGGGREHALTWKLANDSVAPKLFCAPGNAGTEAIATNLPIGAEAIEPLVEWSKTHRPDLVVVGPEAPLCDGLADALAAGGIRTFGPLKAAARIEGSKQFAKDVMAAACVPTARAIECTSLDEARSAVASFDLPVVVKADGLAAGKGVVICESRKAAVEACASMLEEHRFGAAGKRVLVEEFLEGEEVSVLALVDGERAVMMAGSQDHKRALDGDKGPNTGGMGAYSPAPVFTPVLADAVQARVLDPTLAELKRRGILYRGVLYAGLMIGPSGPRVLEFNCRFGDPETQVVLPRLGCDLLPVLDACTRGTLTPDMLKWREEACACVVMASGGYPGSYEKGRPISGLESAAGVEGVQVYHAGTARRGTQIVTNGGRVLNVTALGSDLAQAVARAYKAVDLIRFEGAHARRDIAHRALPD